MTYGTETWSLTIGLKVTKRVMKRAFFYMIELGMQNEPRSRILPLELLNQLAESGTLLTKSMDEVNSALTKWSEDLVVMENLGSSYVQY